jgi:hypothetical protein
MTEHFTSGLPFLEVAVVACLVLLGCVSVDLLQSISPETVYRRSFIEAKLHNDELAASHARGSMPQP